MSSRFALAAALFLAAGLSNAQEVHGSATETGKTEPAACQAAGMKASSIAQANQASLLQTEGKERDVLLTKCVCKEDIKAPGRLWTCTRQWTLRARP